MQTTNHFRLPSRAVKMAGVCKAAMIKIPPSEPLMRVLRQPPQQVVEKALGTCHSERSEESELLIAKADRDASLRSA